MRQGKETLRDLLDSIGIHSGDDSVFVLVDSLESLWSSTKMEVSRRYIESEQWKHLLDKNVCIVANIMNSGVVIPMIILE